MNINNITFKNSAVYLLLFLFSFSHQGNLAESVPYKVHRHIEEYLKTTEKPILQVGCGHPTKEDIDNKAPHIMWPADLSGDRYHHQHPEAYTINSDMVMKPDLEANVTPEFLRLFSKMSSKNQFYLIWEDCTTIPSDADNVKELYELLKPGGYLIFRVHPDFEKFTNTARVLFGELKHIEFNLQTVNIIRLLFKQKLMSQSHSGEWDYSKVPERIYDDITYLSDEKEWEEWKLNVACQNNMRKGLLTFKDNVITSRTIYEI
jgi:hypothetical protein